ncbi:unnamed protein product [Aphanomyces euteiches]
MRHQLCLYFIVLLVAVALGHDHHDHHHHDDYYEVLGLEMDASESDIKKAYRKLSLQYHPDKNKGNADAEAKFQKISRAYEILSSPELKDIYDFEGEEGLQRHQNQGNRPPNPFEQLFGGGGGRQRGPDAAVEVAVTLEELYNGGEKSVTFRKNVICRKCRGTGAKDGKTQPCKTCGGQGVVLVNQQMGPGFTVQMQQQCPKCGGRGKTFKTKCPYCNGHKVVEEMKTITGTIERGMPSTHEIVFEREGEQHPGVMPGNVIMRLVQQPHRVFRFVGKSSRSILTCRLSRAGDDLHAQVQISLKDALLGFDIALPHLDGHKVSVAADGVTKPFEVRRIAEEGMPHHHVPSQHGDLYIQHNIRFPTQLTEAQKELVKRLLP